MSQALYTSIGGISASQTQINVVSNNIANLNTVGFKESNLTFQDIFSTTLTAGNAPTVASGGRNPMQIGLGVQVGGISKNFDSGTFISTGRSEDVAIQGNGFLTVMSGEGQLFLTRAGSLSFDADGNLVTPQGYKVVGANSLYSTTTSDTNVKVPERLQTEVIENPNMATKLLSELNGCDITTGTFSISIDGGENIQVTISDTDNTMAKIATKIQNTIDGAATTDARATFIGTKNTGTTPLSADEIKSLAANPSDATLLAKLNAGLGTPVTQADIEAVTATSGVTVACNGAKIDFNAGAKTLEFTTGSSNFVMQTQLATAVKDPLTNTYSSKILDSEVIISKAVAPENSVAISTTNITSSGAIEAVYSNGDKITLEHNQQDNTFGFKYTTASGIIIKGDDVQVNNEVIVPPNFQIQMCNVTNPEGLLAEGSNLFSVGPNAGEMFFSIAGAMGVGSLQSGGLEASNVDMAKQFSDMILAQRAIQANSRVFDTASNVMQSIVYMGQG